MTIEEAFNDRFGEDTFRVESTGTQIYKQCPDCGQKTLSCNINKGIFNCWFCSYSGKLDINLQDLQLERSREARKQVDQKLKSKVLHYLWENITLDPLHKQYLKDRGICNPEKYGLKSIPFKVMGILSKEFTRDELAKAGVLSSSNQKLTPCIALLSERVMVPFFRDKKVVEVKTRSTPYEVITNTPKYVSTYGSQSNNMLWLPKNCGAELIVTEGEFKALVACEAGFPTCSIPGVGFGKILARYIKEFAESRQVKRIFIILDTDKDFESKPQLKIQANNIAKIIGKEKCCVCFLPQIDKNLKVDLDSFILQFGREKLAEILETAWQKKLYE